MTRSKDSDSDSSPRPGASFLPGIMIVLVATQALSEDQLELEAPNSIGEMELTSRLAALRRRQPGHHDGNHWIYNIRGFVMYNNM